MKTAQELLDHIEKETGKRPSPEWLTLRIIRKDILPNKTIGNAGRNVINTFTDDDAAKLVSGIRRQKWFPPLGHRGQP
jgi:hypothetical protein